MLSMSPEGTALAARGTDLSHSANRNENTRKHGPILSGLCEVNCCRAEVQNLVERASTATTRPPKTRRDNQAHDTFRKTWIIISIHIFVGLDVLPRDLVFQTGRKQFQSTPLFSPVKSD